MVWPARRVPAGLRLPVVDAARLTAPVPLPEWGTARDARAVFHPPARTAINAPRFLNRAQGEVRLLGPFYLWPEVGRVPAKFPEETVSPQLTLARLTDVICLPGQIALHWPEGGAPVVLEECLTSRWDHHGVHLDKIDDDGFALRDDLVEPETLPGRYLYLDNMHSPHFGHFLTDVLSKVWAWDAARAAGLVDLAVLVEAHEPPHAFALLEACGVPRRAIRAVKRPVRCKEVLFAAQSFLIQGWTSPVAMATWARIREALDDGHGPEKVFVSRSRVPNRKMVNEAAVEEVFRRRGFFIAHPQELTMRQQVTMWANARIVAGTAGSNMFGLAFQRRLQKTLLINSPNFLHFQEMFMQAGCASETSFYFGQALDGEVHGAWRVAPDDLAAHVDGWLGTPAPPAGRVPAPPRLADHLALFDEVFYLRRNADVRVAVAAGGTASGRRHFEQIGFDEGRPAFLFDAVWYAGQYPEVLAEVAAGNFVDGLHHYLAIGRLIENLPHQPALAAPAPDPAEEGHRPRRDADPDAPWRHIDLGEAKAIGEVRIHPAQPAGERHAELVLQIAIDPEAWIEVGRVEARDGEALGWRPGLPAYARFLRLSLLGDDVRLERVEVFAPGRTEPMHVAQAEAEAEPAQDPELFSRFISLGDNCEFGLVQRAVGLEPLDLLRFASTGDDEAGLILGMEERFAAFGTQEDLRLSVDGVEWIAWSVRYGMSFHTGRNAGAFSEAQMRLELGKRLRLLADKLVEDLEAGDRIFLRRSNRPAKLRAMFALKAAMERYGAPFLLWVDPDDKCHAMVAELAPGFVRGSIRRLAPYEQATDIRVQDWRELCRAVLAWRETNGKADNATSVGASMS